MCNMVWLSSAFPRQIISVQMLTELWLYPDKFNLCVQLLLGCYGYNIWQKQQRREGWYLTHSFRGFEWHHAGGGMAEHFCSLQKKIWKRILMSLWTSKHRMGLGMGQGVWCYFLKPTLHNLLVPARY